MKDSIPEIVYNLMKECSADMEHAKQVEDYAMKLFSAMSIVENFSEREKLYLRIAALLHDIGYCVEKKSHHKHTMQIILDNGIDGFSSEEVSVIANIARYHRAAYPDESKHSEFALLSNEQKNLVKKLSALLRIADGMDKPHKNLILRIEAKETEQSFDFYIKTIGFKPKLDMAKEKSSLFELVYGKTVNFLFM